MNTAPYTHLVWKEYRAIRGFWLALIALAVFMEVLVLAFAQNPGWATELVYNIALGTPVFFAIGCIGTAYALEKEDGTFEWLRSSPVSDGQLLISKVGLCLVATAAMFGILWLVTQTLLVAPPRDPNVIRGLLGLWLLAALEALAWGLLFSLLSARPLTAIVLALFATSTSVHLLSWTVQSIDRNHFQYSRYVNAIPLRLGLLTLVAAADVYLGLRWLGSEERTSLLAPREKEDAAARRPATKADVAALLHRRDRAVVLGRLLWQTFRQSGRMMFTLAALQVLMCFLFRFTGLEGAKEITLPVIPLVTFAALMGGSVFQADQQRGHFRYFVEHNVPPRYVWLGRLLPWMAVATFSTFLSVCLWIGPWLILQLLAILAHYVGSLHNPHSVEWGWTRYETLVTVAVLPAIGFSPLVIFAFAAGQWVSMTVRSGLLAGFFSLLLTLFLIAWAVAVFFMQLSWFIYLVPVPFVLFFATWLRAPDWILESTTWKARAKAIGVVLIPALLLLTAAPFSRIAQIPVESPGFDQAVYVAEIGPAALETGQIYRRAYEMYDDVSITRPDRLPFRSVDERTKVRVSKNQGTLDLILEASRRESCALANPATLTNWPVLTDGRLQSITKYSAHVLEDEKKFEESLDRYLTAFTVERQLSSFAPRIDEWPMPQQAMETMQLLVQWASRPDQTEANLREAIARLQQVDASVLNWEDALKSNYILCRRFLDGDPSAGAILFPGKNSAKEVARITFNMRLFPWERVREQRSVDRTLALYLRNLASLRLTMDHGECVAHLVDPNRDLPYEGLLSGGLTRRMQVWGNGAKTAEVSFEVYRRATLLTLACQAYRIAHGELPKSLDDLRDYGIEEHLFNDPLTGRPFVYFREGIPEPRTASEEYATRHRWGQRYQISHENLKPGVPCLWSPGWDLHTNTLRLDEKKPETETAYYVYRWVSRATPYYTELPDYKAWLQGDWFPIPVGK